MVEVEARADKFRRGENARKPYLGIPSDDPFVRELHRLTAPKFVSQLALARALVGEGQSAANKQGSISNWFTGKNSPSPKEFINLARVLKPNEQELQTLIGLYQDRTGRTIGLENSIV